MFNLLISSRVIQVIKTFCWKIHRIIVRPLEWLEPPKKRSQKNSQLTKKTPETDPSNALHDETGSIQQQQSSNNSSLIEENKKVLEDSGLDFDTTNTEVLDRPTNEIKLALEMFNLRGGFEKIIDSPEGWIRTCLRKRYWEKPNNYNALLRKVGIEDWQELFPDEDSDPYSHYEMRFCAGGIPRNAKPWWQEPEFIEFQKQLKTTHTGGLFEF